MDIFAPGEKREILPLFLTEIVMKPTLYSCTVHTMLFEALVIYFSIRKGKLGKISFLGFKVYRLKGFLGPGKKR